MLLRRSVLILKRALQVLAIVLATVLAVRAWDSQRGAPLSAWHTHAPHELRAGEIDRADWGAYLAAEAAAFDEVRREVVEALPERERVSSNRYYAASPANAGRFAQDWNRSCILQPEGAVAGAVVLLHGLTDSPYSLRHIAHHYRDAGWIAVSIRMPGHGTVPAGLTEADWEDWMAATRLAVREARRRAGPAAPLHVVGYSNGGALALKYALDTLDDPSLPKPGQLVLLSPMVGVTSMARFAGLLGWPSVFPAFAKAAWLDIVPEYNPFKYNSFPVHAARQSSLLTRALQQQLARRSGAGLAGLPPILTFQSVLDYTVSTRAVVDGLYAALPANGSELVLFDLNHNAHLGALLRPDSAQLADRLLPPAPRRFRATIVGNARTNAQEVQEETTEAGATAPQLKPLGLAYPRDVYSLSHVALPFPPGDGLYGMQPGVEDDFGVKLGAMAARGERSALIVDLDSVMRMSSNPFFPYVLSRIDAVRAAPRP